MRPERAVLAIPAFNEEECIDSAVRFGLMHLRRGVVDDFVVIDDGSTDRTAEVASSLGAKVVRLEENLGKGGAFLHAAKYCKEQGAGALVMIDADVICAPGDCIALMLDELYANDNEGRPCTMMAVAPQAEGNGRPQTAYSGQRAIRLEALTSFS